MSEAMAGVAPPVSGFLPRGTFGTQSADRLTPIDARCTFDRPTVRRAYALCTTVLGTRLWPTRYFAGPLARRRRVPAAETLIFADVIPEYAIAAFATSDRLGHPRLPPRFNNQNEIFAYIILQKAEFGPRPDCAPSIIAALTSIQ